MNTRDALGQFETRKVNDDEWQLWKWTNGQWTQINGTTDLVSCYGMMVGLALADLDPQPPTHLDKVNEFKAMLQLIIDNHIPVRS